MSCYFFACCIASGEPAQIHGSISKMKMEIQSKLWTSRYEKGALTVAYVHKCALTACADPGVFDKGVQARQPEKKTGLTTFFVVLFVFRPQIILQFRLKSTFIQQLTFQG